jgi:hypothetical protein
MGPPPMRNTGWGHFQGALGFAPGCAGQRRGRAGVLQNGPRKIRDRPWSFGGGGALRDIQESHRSLREVDKAAGRCWPALARYPGRPAEVHRGSSVPKCQRGSRGDGVEKAHEDGLAWHEGMDVLDSYDFDQAAGGERGLSVHADLERHRAAPLIPHARPPFC